MHESGILHSLPEGLPETTKKPEAVILDEDSVTL
jgi:hypothetical protein